MNLLRTLKSLLPYKLKNDIKNNLGVPSFTWSLKNLKKIGYTPNYILDVGAYEGHWTKDFISVFPNVNILMLEAQESKRMKLEKISCQYANIKFSIVLLSDEDGRCYNFIENETASHVTSVNHPDSIVILSKKIDTLLSELKYPNPDFIKIDVQGHELEVLRGAQKALENCIFCLLEVTLMNIGNEPLVLDVMNYMDNQGFQLYDISQFMRRPFDCALYQSDFLFIRKNSLFVSDKRWN